jgi:hypothetical protein
MAQPIRAALMLCITAPALAVAAAARMLQRHPRPVPEPLALQPQLASRIQRVRRPAVPQPSDAHGVQRLVLCHARHRPQQPQAARRAPEAAHLNVTVGEVHVTPRLHTRVPERPRDGDLLARLLDRVADVPAQEGAAADRAHVSVRGVQPHVGILQGDEAA